MSHAEHGDERTYAMSGSGTVVGTRGPIAFVGAVVYNGYGTGF
jgi:hypothetical protein